jgi:membrane protease subunit (stomatin/prohibitin family)
MVMRRRRPLLRAAVVGGVAYKAGQNRANQQAAPQDYNAAQPQAQQPAAQPAQPVSGEDTVTQLTKLKDLLDAGVLTQAEFESQKQKILNS